MHLSNALICDLWLFERLTMRMWNDDWLIDEVEKGKERKGGEERGLVWPAFFILWITDSCWCGLVDCSNLALHYAINRCPSSFILYLSLHQLYHQLTIYLFRSHSVIHSSTPSLCMLPFPSILQFLSICIFFLSSSTALPQSYSRIPTHSQRSFQPDEIVELPVGR